MIELRLVNISKSSQQLQYRHLLSVFNAPSQTGHLTDKWSEWKDVPVVDSNDVAYEDLAASGGLAATG